jgi:DNA-binding GntR family transcriptional regulator
MTSVGRGSLRDLAYEALKKRIIQVDLRPGQRIVERDLAEELKVSRIPLREALRLLAAEGLVVLVPHRGALVSPFTPTDVRDLFDIRESVEVLAARLAAERANEHNLGPLTRCLESARAATESGDEAEIAVVNARFHAEIVALSDNALLETMMRPLNARMEWLFRLTSDRDPHQQCAEHTELYEAIAAGDPARTAEVALRHVVSGRDTALQLAAGWAVTETDPVKITHGRRRRPS